MDETQASIKSTSDAAKKRKRRSSILKNQRPPRTPLSEIELTVDTPTDTAKSRRVSFSRRTGVAEFVTNEATTTWKNFYEEHNKSLESSANESAANAPRQMSIGHIGKRIFDQQFEEIEVIDIGGILQPTTLAQDFHTSLNKLNITQQLASLECLGDDRKLTAPVHNFEMSSLTDHQSKLFGDDPTIPTMPEMTNPININFSNLQSIGCTDKCDDLDEIVKDLERSRPVNIICPGPTFNGNREMSEYIEVDLDMTHVGIKHDDYEMSITDTICNPEIQELSKSISGIHNKKNLNIDNNWIVDKENIAINPYVTPKESKNFAVNESSDKILVFDGKKLSVKSERKTVFIPEKKENFRTTLLPDLPTGSTPKRKTIVLNVNDNLPNFIQGSSAVIGNQEYNRSQHIPQLKQSVIYNECDLSITQALSNKIEVPRRKTIVFDDGNISITQAVPANVIINKQERRKTVIYENDNGNISVTQAVPTNIITANETGVEKRKSILYEQDISFTKALPSNLILNNKSVLSQDRTMYYQDEADMSLTQAIPQNIMNVVKNECSKGHLSNISITQAIPSNIIIAEDKPVNITKTIIYGTHEDADIEITQAVPENVLLKPKNEKRNTIVFENDTGDISITQAVPANILFEKAYMDCDTKIEETKIEGNISLYKSNIQYEQPEGELNLDNLNHVQNTSNKIKTIIYSDEVDDISITQVMPTNIIVSKELEKQHMETSSDHDITDISMTCDLPVNILLQNSTRQMQDNLCIPTPTLDIENNMATANLNISNKEWLKNNVSRRQSEFYENNVSNLSMTKPIPSDIFDNLLMQKENLKKTEVYAEKILHVPQTKDFMAKNNLPIKQDILIYQAVEHLSHSRIRDQINLTTEDDVENKISNVSLNIKAVVNDSHVTVSNNCLNVSSVKINENIAHEEKIEMELLTKNNSIAACGNTSKVLDQNVKIKNSFLNELLDMSNASLDDVVKLDVRATESQIVLKPLTNEDTKSNIDTNSNESLFVIMKDSEDDVKEQNDEDKENISENVEVEITNLLREPVQKDIAKLPTLEYIEESEDVQDLENEISALKPVNEQKRTSTNRHYETIVSTDLDKSTIKELSVRRGKKSLKNADDTRELLGMLSDFTEEPIVETENRKSVAPIEVKVTSSIEKKCEPKHLSFIPKRQSIVLSREELLNNISMAQAALQQSRFEIDENETIDDTRDSPEPVIENRSRRKSVRMSTEVVKTLQFEEEDSITDTNQKSDMKVSPLKKTAFGETSYMRESKAKVIPSHLKDVSDDIKALMSDLVKPMADVMPFDAVGLNKSLKKSPSTCSTQIQANLITSSQIDIDIELHSNPESIDDIQTNRSVAETSALDHKVNHAVNSIQPVSASMEIDQVPVLESPTRKRSILKSPVKSPVIVFDYFNPLNNVQLPPRDSVKPHKYSPIISTDTICVDHENSTHASHDDKNKDSHFKAERMSTHYNIETLQSGDTRVEEIKDCNSSVSNISKPLSIDRSTEGFCMEVKSIEVNTLIVMKGNKELLEASSSLTLVDDAFAQNPFDVKTETIPSDETDNEKSALRVIYKMETECELLCDSDITSNDEFDEVNDNLNTRKRSYSPSKRDQNNINKSEVDVTPKPVNKMQKISNSPRLHKDPDKVDFDAKTPNIQSKITSEKSPKNDRNNEITVQRVTTEYNRNIPTDEITGNKSLKFAEDILNPKSKITPQQTLKNDKNNEITDQRVTREYNRSIPTEAKSGKKCLESVEDALSPNSKIIPEKASNIDRNYETIVQCVTTEYNRSTPIDETTGKKSLESIEGTLSPNSKIVPEKILKNDKNEITVPCVTTGYKNVPTEEKPTKKNLESVEDSSLSIAETLSTSVKSVVIASSFTSSKNAREMQDVDSCELSSGSSQTEPLKNISSQNFSDTYCGSVNVVDKINMMKFMGNRECEWESSSGEVWSFLLLRSRVRLIARLAHTHRNACSSRVRADTPLEGLTVEPVTEEVKDPLGALCVRLACAAMRRSCVLERSCARAGDVVARLQRCASVARVALLWGRAMRDARLRLAYTLTPDGELTLKVANCPLRAVWDVRMRVELAVEDEQELPWPRAVDLKVHAVLTHSVPDVSKAVVGVPKDWRHVPATIWAVFKFLKNKTREDDQFLDL